MKLTKEDANYCTDERHGEPCPQPCTACEEECRKEGVGFTNGSRHEYTVDPTRYEPQGVEQLQDDYGELWESRKGFIAVLRGLLEAPMTNLDADSLEPEDKRAIDAAFQMMATLEDREGQDQDEEPGVSGESGTAYWQAKDHCIVCGRPREDCKPSTGA